MNYEPWFMENFRDLFSSAKPLQAIINKYKNRPYHNLEHIYNMIQFIDKNYRTGNFLLMSDIAYWSIIFAVLYHDVIYKVGNDTNEEESASYFKNDFYDGSIVTNNLNQDLVIQHIMATKHHNSLDVYDQAIITADLAGLLFADFKSLIEDEKKLFKEYQKYNVNNYRNGRVCFLMDFWDKRKQNNNIPQYIDYIKNKEYSIGIYCGSFNPMHIGHKNILDKAEHLFDKVIVARGINGLKLSSIPYAMPELPNQIVEYSNIFKLLKSVYSNNNNCKIYIIRGLRNQYDMHQEEVFRKWVYTYDSSVKFVYLFCDNEYEHLSSSSLRELDNIGEDISKYLVKDSYYE